MKQALGLVEIQGLSTAVVVADTMAKAANIRILEIENTKGLGYMTIKVAGDVGAVNAAVNAGRQVGAENQKLVSWKVIPRPSDYVEHTFCDPDEPGPTSPTGKKGLKKEDQSQVSTVPEPEPSPRATVTEDTGLDSAAGEIVLEEKSAQTKAAEVKALESEAVEAKAPEADTAEAKTPESAPEDEGTTQGTLSTPGQPAVKAEKAKAAPGKKAPSTTKNAAEDKKGSRSKRKNSGDTHTI